MGFMWGNTPVTGICWNGNTAVSAMYNGEVVWPTAAAPAYTETLLMSASATANLRNGPYALTGGHPSSFDVLRIVPLSGQAGFVCMPVEVSWRELSSTNMINVECPIYKTTAASGVRSAYWYFDMFSGCSGTSWNWAYRTHSDFRTSLTASSIGAAVDTRAYIKEIWGIKYG